MGFKRALLVENSLVSRGARKFAAVQRTVLFPRRAVVGWLASPRCFAVSSAPVKNSSSFEGEGIVKEPVEDWGGDDFSDTDWDEVLPPTKGTRKGAVTGLVSLVVIVVGAVQLVKALGDCKVVPAASGPTPEHAVSRSEQEVDGYVEDQGTTAATVNDNHDSQPLLVTPADLGESGTVWEMDEHEKHVGPNTVLEETRDEVMQNEWSGTDMGAVTAEPEAVDDDEACDESSAKELDGAGEIDILSADMQPENTDTMEEPEEKTTISANLEQESQFRQVSTEQSDQQLDYVVSEDEVDAIVNDMSLEAVRQRVLLAARSASNASVAARKAASSSVIASEAASTAASAAERATAALGAAQAAMEHGTINEVVKAERRALRAAQIASDAEQRAIDAASTAGSHRNTAEQQAALAADLAALRDLRGPSPLETAREKAPEVWSSFVSMLKAAISAAWNFLCDMWHGLCEQLPWLKTYTAAVFSKLGHVIGDMWWRLQEAAGSVGDFLDRIMSGCSSISRNIGPSVKSTVETIWVAVLGTFSSVAHFFQNLLSSLRSGLNI